MELREDKLLRSYAGHATLTKSRWREHVCGSGDGARGRSDVPLIRDPGQDVTPRRSAFRIFAIPLDEYGCFLNTYIRS